MYFSKDADAIPTFEFPGSTGAGPWQLHTMEYCLAFKKKEILQHATIWGKLEDIILSEISQLQKDKYCMIPLT